MWKGMQPLRRRIRPSKRKIPLSKKRIKLSKTRTLLRKRRIRPYKTRTLQLRRKTKPFKRRILLYKRKMLQSRLAKPKIRRFKRNKPESKNLRSRSQTLLLLPSLLLPSEPLEMTS